jgi:exonuclease III
MKKVLRLKSATWNVRGLGEKEEKLDKTSNKNSIRISVITEIKKKLQSTKETENCVVIYGEVNRYTIGKSGVMIWVHKSVSNKIEYYKFWRRNCRNMTKSTQGIFNSNRGICVNRRQGRIK